MIIEEYIFLGPGCLCWTGFLSDDSAVVGGHRRSLRSCNYCHREPFSHALNASNLPRILWQRERELSLLYVDCIEVEFASQLVYIL